MPRGSSEPAIQVLRAVAGVEAVRNQVQRADCYLLLSLGERTERWIAGHELRYRNHILYCTGHLGHPHLTLLWGGRLLGGIQRGRLGGRCWRRVTGAQEQKRQR